MKPKKPRKNHNKFTCNERLDDAIERVKRIRYDLKYGNLTSTPSAKINNDLKKVCNCNTKTRWHENWCNLIVSKIEEHKSKPNL